MALNRVFAACGLLAGLLCAPLVSAQPLILDTEFTRACETLTAPLRATLAADVPVHFVLVGDESINAFVDKENVVYVNSGLILKAKTAAELQGVLAHELGHVQAKHIFKGEMQGERATMGGIAGAVLGIGAAAAGAPQAGMAIALGSQAGAISNILAHSRTQEAEADQYAIKALHAAHMSAKGMVDMFTTLRTESQLSLNAPPQWLVTHPLPPERLANLQHTVSEELGIDRPGAAGFDFARLQAKVAALTMPPAAVFRKFNGPNDAGRYARALAYAKQGDRSMAESNLSPLLKAHPADPFYHEVMAQMALNEGNLGTAHKMYAALVKQNPDMVLFRLQLANILRAQNAFAEALPLYKRVVQQWPEWDEPWYGLGLTYGSLNKLAESQLALTEANLIEGNTDAAKQSLKLAQHYMDADKAMPADTKQWAESLKTRIDEAK